MSGLLTRFVAMERYAATRACPTCRKWGIAPIICVPTRADADDPERLATHLAHPAICPRCDRDTLDGAKILIGVDWEAI